jgi:hypothetical protein
MSGPVKTDPGQPEPYVSKVDRRTAMLWLGGAVVVAGGAGGLALYAQDRHAKVPPSKGYGTDPNLHNPTVPWPRLMTKAELQTAALIADFILPADANAPSASAVGVPDFIDEWISAPYPDQLKDRAPIRDGLKWVEDEANKRFSQGLFDAAAADRASLLQSLTVKQSDGPMKEPHHFFRLFRALTIGAYYTTPAGFKEIGYIGNVARAVDPGPSDEVKAVLEAAFKKLGV